MFRTATWLHANRKQVVTVSVIVVVAAIVLGVYAWKKSSDETAADSQLMLLPSVLGVTTDTGQTPATPYLNLARDYPGTPAGADARLLGAEALFLEGKYAESEDQFNKFMDNHPESDLLPQAMMGVAAALEAEGKTPDAMRKYQEIIAAYPNQGGLVEPAKLTMARMSEAANKPEQALTYYSELARTQNPYDPWAAEARERAILLLAHHPELRKAEAQAQAQGQAPTANPFTTSSTGNFAPGPPLRQPSSAPNVPHAPMRPAAQAPSAPQRQTAPGVNFLNIPNSATNR